MRFRSLQTALQATSKKKKSISPSPCVCLIPSSKLLAAQQLVQSFRLGSEDSELSSSLCIFFPWITRHQQYVWVTSLPTESETGLPSYAASATVWTKFHFMLVLLDLDIIVGLLQWTDQNARNFRISLVWSCTVRFKTNIFLNGQIQEGSYELKMLPLHLYTLPIRMYDVSWYRMKLNCWVNNLFLELSVATEESFISSRMWECALPKDPHLYLAIKPCDNS